MPRIGDFENLAVIVGAPRCGTTTMARMLRLHPQVAVPFVKEPHFFSQYDLRGLAEDELKERVERDYLTRFFDPPAAGERLALDGSVSYLYVPEQMEPIVRLWPNARFIISVRDPMTMLPSLHQRLIYVGDETITRFEQAWAATADRAAGRRIPRSCVEPRWLRYDEAGRLGTYVERLFAAVGRERCLVVVFDDLVEDARVEYRRVLDFLGLDPFEPRKVRAERATKGVRYPWLQRLLQRPPKILHPYVASVRYRRRFNRAESSDQPDAAAFEKVLSLRKRLLRWNRSNRPAPPVPLHVQQDVRDRLAGDIELLGKLIGRDLSHWLQPRGSSSDASP